MTLRDSFESDLDVFIDADEFGETKVVNGTPMLVVWDTDKLESFGEEDSQLTDPSGIFYDSLVMEVKASVYGTKPAVGQRVTVDDDTYLVIKANEWEGLFEITLQIMAA